jgi:hypothetical protein
VVWTGLIWLMMGTSRGHCERGNKSYGSIKCWEIPPRLSDWQLLKSHEISFSIADVHTAVVLLRFQDCLPSSVPLTRQSPSSS